MDPNGHETNNQEIIGMLHVVLDKARHFAGTPFDCEIALFRNARGLLTKRIHRAPAEQRYPVFRPAKCALGKMIVGTDGVARYNAPVCRATY